MLGQGATSLMPADLVALPTDTGGARGSACRGGADHKAAGSTAGGAQAADAGAGCARSAAGGAAGVRKRWIEQLAVAMDVSVLGLL